MRITPHILLALALTALSANAVAAKPHTLPSGVTIAHHKTGTGAAPDANSVVRVHYRGTLVDGTEFDSSYKRKQPISFPLQNVIPCWTQGVQRMKAGGRATLRCPAATAYGTRGIPGVIPPNSDLTFEVELLAVDQ